MAANQDPVILREAALLLVSARSATLATIHEGAPNASLVTPALTAGGEPILLLSALAAHTKHLTANPACALLVMGTAASGNPQTTPRLGLNGAAYPVPAEGVQKRFLQTHPYAAQYAGFTDFAFWKITVATSQYIGGFAQAAYLNVAALQHEISLLLSDS